MPNNWQYLIAALLASASLAFTCEQHVIDDAMLPPLLQFAPTTSQSASLEKQAIFESIPNRTGHHAATIAAFDDGELIAAWYSYDGPNELDNAAIFTARLAPTDSNWSSPQIIDGLPSPVGNPVLFVDGERTLLFFAHAPLGWSTSSVWQCESADRGTTWSSPTNLDGPPGANVRNPPIRLDDSALLLPAYSDFWLNGFFFRSTDNGETWTTGAAISVDENNLLQPAVVAMNSADELLTVARNRGGGRIWSARSNDGGECWTAASQTAFPNPDSAVALIKLTDGRLVMAYNDSDTARTPLVIAVSADDGATWSKRVMIADGEGNFSYPAMAQSPDGMLHLLYTENRERIVHVMVNPTAVE